MHFLKEHRDINVHERPLPVRTNTNIEVGAAVLRLCSALAVTLVTGDGVGEQRVVPSEPTPLPTVPAPEPDAPGRVAHTYQFKDWTGPEDLVSLSTRYLAEITRIVAEGRSLGFLTP